VLHAVVLGTHVAAGSAGLVAGPIAMLARKERGWHTRAGLIYQAAIALLAASALGLVAFAPARLWGFALIAAATELTALAGWRARRRHRPGWVALHVGLMAGSYVSLVRSCQAMNSPCSLATASGCSHHRGHHGEDGVVSFP